MLRVVDMIAHGTWNPALASDRIVLSYDDRHRRRFRFIAQGGTEFLLDLPRPAQLQHGDGLRLSDDTIVAVEAAAEPLMEIRAETAEALARLAWHIGNRHLSAEIHARSIRLRDDHVIAAMLEGLGASVMRVNAPFSPEGGAYAGVMAEHGHGHAHRHDHAHHDEAGHHEDHAHGH